MNGTKIFISGGDHDLTDNIIHMVIAKIPDENGQIHDDLSTVNFFMVPKFLVEAKTARWARATASPPAASKRRWASRARRLRAQFRRCGGLASGPKAGASKPGEKRSASAPAWRACSA